MPNYYVDFEILGAPCDEAFLRNRLFNVIHGAINNYFVGKVGLSFPGYNDDFKNITLGKHIRAFGSEANLSLLSRQSGLIRLAECNAIRIARIMPTPALTGFVRFIRDRTMEKQSKGFLARCERRRQKRGTNNDSVINSSQVVKSVNLISLPYLKLQSASNRFTFSLYIRKEAAIEPQTGIYSGYGLSQAGSTVPWF